MSGISNLNDLLREMQPELQPGEYIFTTVETSTPVPEELIIGGFKEKEGKTVIMERSNADHLGLSYSFIASWIILKVHSSLNAVGLTASFSNALAAHGISCNVVAAYHHDHIFVASKDRQRAMEVLNQLSALHK